MRQGNFVALVNNLGAYNTAVLTPVLMTRFAPLWNGGLTAGANYYSQSAATSRLTVIVPVGGVTSNPILKLSQPIEPKNSNTSDGASAAQSGPAIEKVIIMSDTPSDDQALG
jgi:hypothetical protein